MLRRGWEILGCDLTPAMLAEARAKFGDAVPLETADIRELPVFGEFELVWALNDVINYLVGDGDLERALKGMRATNPLRKAGTSWMVRAVTRYSSGLSNSRERPLGP